MNRKKFADAFQAKYKKDAGMIDSADTQQEILSIPTGILSFDTATGIGGFPRGRIVEVFGPESGGKSLLTLVAVAYAQKLWNINALYFDIEGCTPKEWLSTLGINLSKFDVASAGLCAEQYLDAIIMAIKARVYDYIIIDSVAGLLSRAELEGQVDKNYMAELARAMSLGIKKILPVLSAIPSKSAPCVIFINQTRDKVGVIYGESETTPGGKALKFYSSQRYRVTRKSKSEITEGGDIAGHTVVIKNRKNKLGPPKRVGEFHVHYTKGVDIAGSIMNMVKDRKLYKKVGAKYHLQLEDKLITFDKVSELRNKILEDQEFQTRVYNFLIQNYTVTKENKENEEIDKNIDDEFDDFK